MGQCCGARGVCGSLSISIVNSRLLEQLMYLHGIGYVSFLSIVKRKVISVSGAKQNEKRENKVFKSLVLGLSCGGQRWRETKENICPRNDERSIGMRCGKSINISHRLCLSVCDFHSIRLLRTSSACSLKVFCRSPLRSRTEK